MLKEPQATIGDPDVMNNSTSSSKIIYFWKMIAVMDLKQVDISQCQVIIVLLLVIIPLIYELCPLMAYAMRPLGSLLGIKYRVLGKEILENEEPCIYICNHQSSLDLIGMAYMWPHIKKCSIVAKRELMYAGPFGFMCWLSRTIKLWIFPEGTRNHSESEVMLPFKKGAFHLAVQAQIPIVPVVFSSYSQFYDKNNMLFRSGGTISIKVLQPVSTTGVNSADIPKFSETLRDAMLEVHREISDNNLIHNSEDGGSSNSNDVRDNVDRNGYISWQDYELLALRSTFQQSSWKYDESIHRRFLQHSREMWNTLCSELEKDTNGNVHFLDMVDYMYKQTRKVKAYEELPKFIQDLAEEVFVMIDRKGDGIWDRDEYRFGSVLWCYVTNLEEIDEAFQDMIKSSDASVNGITRKKYRELVTEFFTSMDPNTLSKNIFGPLDPNRADELLKKVDGALSFKACPSDNYGFNL
ncbi:1-acyl-sn-glycerol-3-phosphate acyltransferase alpha [Nymphon striatum]|nr:1-acyl-sn-glycerol-3-phosphate acyltransferase alpha [Nymphon striatum]